VVGPFDPRQHGTSGIEDLQDLERLPADFTGGIWTDRIEVVGPAMGAGGDPVTD
jgi:glycerophosphoryl diester phosphodiesterase